MFSFARGPGYPHRASCFLATQTGTTLKMPALSNLAFTQGGPARHPSTAPQPKSFPCSTWAGIRPLCFPPRILDRKEPPVRWTTAIGEKRKRGKPITCQHKEKPEDGIAIESLTRFELKRGRADALAGNAGPETRSSVQRVEQMKRTRQRRLTPLIDSWDRGFSRCS